MSGQIIFQADVFLELVDSMLRDENGVSHQTYETLYRLCVYRGYHELWVKICEHVDATDNRFYLVEDAPRLYVSV